MATHTGRRLLIFDLDGTLIDSVHLVAQVVNEEIRRAGTDGFSVARYRGWVGHGLRNLVDQAYRAAGGEAALGGVAFEPWYQRLKELYGARAATETPPYDGTAAALNNVRARSDTRLAVLTNKIEAITVEIVSALFPQLFDSICGLTEAYPPKPDPARANELMRIHQVMRKDCVLIGDSVIDQQTAAAAGIGFCAVLWGYWSESERTALLALAAKQTAIAPSSGATEQTATLPSSAIAAPPPIAVVQTPNDLPAAIDTVIGNS